MMTYTIHPLVVRFPGQKQKRRLHFTTFHCGALRFNEFSDDGHKTMRQAAAYGRRVCKAVNG